VEDELCLHVTTLMRALVQQGMNDKQLLYFR